DHCFERGVNILCRTASPFLAARHQFELDYTFRPEVHRNDPVEILSRVRHEHADTFLERSQHFRTPNELWNVWRTDLLFAFGNHYQIHRHLLARASNRM